MAYQIIIVAVAAVLQNSGLIAILGVKPNLVISVALPLIFFIKDFWRYFLVALIAGGLLASFPLLDFSAVIFVSAAAVSYFVKDWLPWRPFFNNFILLSSATIAVAIPQIFPLEIIYNVFLGSAFFLIYAKAKNKF